VGVKVFFINLLTKKLQVAIIVCKEGSALCICFNILEYSIKD